MPPILLDSDIGTDVDDALALALLLSQPDADLCAVTTVSGDTLVRARIAKKLLVLGGRPGVPVAAGVRLPVLRQRNFLWLGHEGQGIVGPDEPLEVAAQHAVDLLIDVVTRQRPHIVAIGPLSNLAVALMKAPEIAAAIAHLTLMGGLFERGSGSPLLDYNLCSDAEAALVVLTAGIPTTIVPLDATRHVFLRAADVDRLRRSSSQLLRILCAAIDLWAPLQRGIGGTPIEALGALAFLHDPLAVAAAVAPAHLRVERRHLRPELDADGLRLVAEAAAPAFEVATDIDAPAFVSWFVDRLLALT